MRRWFAGVALVGLLALVWVATTAQFVPNAQTAIQESANPPANTRLPWIETGTGAVFFYSPAETLWLSPVLDAIVGKNGSSVTGALGVLSTGMSCDTTTGGAVGLFCADSTVLMGMSWFAKRASPPAAVNCTTQVYKCLGNGGGNTLVNQTYWGASETGATVLATKLFWGPNEPVAVYLKPKSSGAVSPAMPQIKLRLYRFRRPV